MSTRDFDELPALERSSDGQLPALGTVETRSTEAGAALLDEHQIAVAPQRQQPFGIAGEGTDARRAGATRDEENRRLRMSVGTRYAAERHLYPSAAWIAAILGYP